MTRTDFRLGGQKVRVDWAEPLNDPGEDVMAQVTTSSDLRLSCVALSDMVSYMRR